VQTNYWRIDRFRGKLGGVSIVSSKGIHVLHGFSSNPSNWLGPVWIIVNYFVWRGLKILGSKDEASKLAAQTLRLLSTDLATNGSLNEYYHPDTGMGLSHKFMDWNLLVLEMM